MGAVALAQSLEGIRDRDPGFRIDGMSSAFLVADPDSPREAASTTYLQSLLLAVRALPGVQSAALTDTRPAGGYIRTTVVGVADEPAGRREVAGNLDIVSPAFFDTMGIRLESGRDFNSFDDSTRTSVAIVSASWRGNSFPMDACWVSVSASASSPLDHVSRSSAWSAVRACATFGRSAR